MNLETQEYYAVYKRDELFFYHRFHSFAAAATFCHGQRHAMPYYGVRGEAEWLTRPENQVATLALCMRWEEHLAKIHESRVSAQKIAFATVASIVRKGRVSHEQ